MYWVDSFAVSGESFRAEVLIHSFLYLSHKHVKNIT